MTRMISDWERYDVDDPGVLGEDVTAEGLKRYNQRQRTALAEEFKNVREPDGKDWNPDEMWDNIDEMIDGYIQNHWTEWLDKADLMTGGDEIRNIVSGIVARAEKLRLIMHDGNHSLTETKINQLQKDLLKICEQKTHTLCGRCGLLVDNGWAIESRKKNKEKVLCSVCR